MSGSPLQPAEFTVSCCLDAKYRSLPLSRPRTTESISESYIRTLWYHIVPYLVYTRRANPSRCHFQSDVNAELHSSPDKSALHSPVDSIVPTNSPSIRHRHMNRILPTGENENERDFIQFVHFSVGSCGTYFPLVLGIPSSCRIINLRVKLFRVPS